MQKKAKRINLYSICALFVYFKINPWKVVKNEYFFYIFCTCDCCYTLLMDLIFNNVQLQIFSNTHKYANSILNNRFCAIFADVTSSHEIFDSFKNSSAGECFLFNCRSRLKKKIGHDRMQFLPKNNDNEIW